MKSRFVIKYQVEDGYVGNRPISVAIDSDYIDGIEDEGALLQELDVIVTEDIAPRACVLNTDEFLEWAKAYVEEAAKEEDE